MGLKVKESEGYCGTVMAEEKVSLALPSFLLFAASLAV